MFPHDISPSVIIFDVFGTLVKIGERRSPYRKLMRHLGSVDISTMHCVIG